MARRIGSLIQNNRELVVLGLLLESSLLIFVTVTGVRRGSYLLEVFFWLPFAIYLLTIWRVSKAEETAAAPRQIAAIVLFFAFLFHATVLFSPSPLSNDIYRYYWDGKVVNHGLNPYAYSPNADAVRSLIDVNWEKVENKNVHTMYPPLSQVVFAVAYFVFPSTFTLRLFSVSFNFLAIGILILILRELGFDVRYSVVYAWSPLAAIEFANSGHIDSLAVLLTLWSFLALIRRRRILSAAALALAVLAKIYPILFAGLFLTRWRKRGTLIFAGLIAASYLPFLGAGTALFRGSAYFVRRGLFNGSLFPLLLASMEGIMGRAGALRFAQMLVLLIFTCLLALLYSRLRQQEENDLLLWRYSFWLTGAFLLLTPTMHPWYLTWVLPFLCFFRSAGWILLTGTAILARSVYIGYEATGVWQEIGWIKPVEYVFPYLLMLYDLILRIRSWRRGEETTEGRGLTVGRCSQLVREVGNEVQDGSSISFGR